jgi:hypothetical protein
MSILDQLHELFVKTHLYPLVRLLLPAAEDNKDAAWAAARDVILLHNPQSEAEFRLACRLAVFSIQATQSAAEASATDVSPPVAARLRRDATSFAREADKAEHRLEQLKQSPVQAPEPAVQQAVQPAAETKPAQARLPPDKKEEMRQIAAYARKNNLTYPQAWTHYELEKKRKATLENATQATAQPAAE